MGKVVGRDKGKRMTPGTAEVVPAETPRPETHDSSGFDLWNTVNKLANVSKVLQLLSVWKPSLVAARNLGCNHVYPVSRHESG